jgi:RNA polymerase sigma factor
MDSSSLDLYIDQVKNQIDLRNQFIHDYTPFVIKHVSEIKHAYVCVRNDDEFSIALIAFNEAIDRYEISKGHFLSFARIVIESRLKNYWEKEKHHQHDDISNVEVAAPSDEDLHLELIAYENELSYFGLSFEDLSNHMPKHTDTKEAALNIAQEIALNAFIMTQVYIKKSLPVTLVSKSLKIGLKMIKNNKIFILGTSIIFYKKFDKIENWLNK